MFSKKLKFSVKQQNHKQVTLFVCFVLAIFVLHFALFCFVFVFVCFFQWPRAVFDSLCMVKSDQKHTCITILSSKLEQTNMFSCTINHMLHYDIVLSFYIKILTRECKEKYNYTRPLACAVCYGGDTSLITNTVSVFYIDFFQLLLVYSTQCWCCTSNIM